MIFICKMCSKPFDFPQARDFDADSLELLKNSMICPRCADSERQRVKALEEQKRLERLALSYAQRREKSNLDSVFLPLDFDHKNFNKNLFDFVSLYWRHESLFVCDKTGVGKTRILSHFSDKFLKEVGSVYVTTSAALYDKLASLFSKKVELGERFLNELAYYDLIFIDDLGKENFSESKKSRLWQILNQRYTATNQHMSGYPTYKRGYRIWVTSQLGSAELLKAYGANDGSAIIRRIIDISKIYS